MTFSGGRTVAPGGGLGAEYPSMPGRTDVAAIGELEGIAVEVGALGSIPCLTDPGVGGRI